MKLKFDSTLDYQHEAIDAVVNVFNGQPIVLSNFKINAISGSELLLSELGVGNNITLSDNELLTNVQKIQTANGIERTSRLEGREFSIEMETGTGKTYVYLRTIFELSKKYGIKKFIIVVPSVAIREGVLKSIEMTKMHFLTLYDNEPFEYFVYDSAKLGLVRQFATSNQIQIMVINIQSFQKDVLDVGTSQISEDKLRKLNIINRENDKMSGRKPIEFIQAAKPVVIIDEPQSVDNTENAKRAVANLKPITTLRYSATHRNSYNLLYKLDPVKAYDLKLVKRIEVASVRTEDSFNDAYVKLLKTDNENGIKAQVEIHRERQGKIQPTKFWIKVGDDLFVKSGEREIYCDGYIVQSINCESDAECIKFYNSKSVELGVELGGLKDDIMKAQVFETVEQHLKKERSFCGKGIKVLSLFFVDKVANYRIYNEDGSTQPGKIGIWFEQAYKEITAKADYEDFTLNSLGCRMSEIHNGYFSKDRTGNWKDSTEIGSKDDHDTYSLIMRDKERLLDLEEPLRFIFSHSALREGWDSPNVFQICTLNETASVVKKRQEIGRGLRLPVNIQGERVHDTGINRLTVIANESYEDFAKSLQNELESDFGVKFGRIGKNTFARIVRDQIGEETEIGEEESEIIWNELLAAGYINNLGEIQKSFEPSNRIFELKIDERYEDIKPAIIDLMQSCIFNNRVVNSRNLRVLKFNKQVQLSSEFLALWNQINHRTRYSVSIDSNKLIETAVERIESLDEIKPVKIKKIVADVGISKAGVNANPKHETVTREEVNVNVLPDILTYLQNETELTRQTIYKILKRLRKLSAFKNNPQKFMTMVARAISEALNDLMLEGIQYEKIADQYWEMSRIKEDGEESIRRNLDNLNVYEVQNKNKSLYDAVIFDSETEKQFAKDLDINENVRLFVKLPNWFKIDTPIGSYNPDWAFVTERDQMLYFVRETKSTKNSREWRSREKQKVDCGRYHFKAIGVNYGVVTKLSEVDF